MSSKDFLAFLSGVMILITSSIAEHSQPLHTYEPPFENSLAEKIASYDSSSPPTLSFMGNSKVKIISQQLPPIQPPSRVPIIPPLIPIPPPDGGDGGGNKDDDDDDGNGHGDNGGGGDGDNIHF